MASAPSAPAPATFIAFLVKDGAPVLAGPTFAGPDPAAALEWCSAMPTGVSSWKVFTLTPFAAAAPASSAPAEPKPAPVRAFLLPMNGKPYELFLSADKDGEYRAAMTRVVLGPPIAYFHTKRCHETFMLFVGKGDSHTILNPNLPGHRIRGPAIVVRGTGPHDLSTIPACVEPKDWATLFDR